MKYKQADYFLATTAIEEFWDTTKPILFLGEWCRRYSRKSFWEPLDHEVLNSPWEDIKKYYDAARYVFDVYERLLAVLGEALNKIHATEHSKRYWRIVVGSWLQRYITVVYDRYMSLQMALDKCPNLTTTVLSEKDWVTPADTLEFVKFVMQDSYNLQIYSRILKLLGKTFPQKNYSITPRRCLSEKSLSAKNRLKNLTIVILGKASRAFKSGHSIILRDSCFSTRAQLRLVMKAKGTVWPILGDINQTLRFGIDTLVRAKLQNIFSPKSDFEVLLGKLLPLDIPQSFIEGFEAVAQVVSLHYPQRTKAIFCGAAWYTEDIFNRWAADSSERGTKLFGVQHGGYYGSLEFFPYEYHELGITDRYFSWGWEKSSAPDKVSPSSAAKLSCRKSLGADNRKEGILFAATAWTRYLVQFPWVPIHHREYPLWQFRFIKKMKPEILSKMRVRFHRDDWGWDFAQRWADFCPDVSVENWGVPFFNSLDNCRLCVIDHQGTTFLEALAANKPTVLFWDPVITQPKPQAQPYYDRLRTVGILYDTPEAAADTVSTIYSDTAGWWNHPERQEARRVFCNHFARISSNALDEWAEEFMRISKYLSREI